MDGTSPDTEQGKSLLAANASKTKRVQSRANYIDVYAGPSGPTNALYESAAESFTGMGAPKSEDRNARQREKVDALSAKFRKALSDYASAEKAMNDVASAYLNLRDSSKQSMAGQFVKGSGDTVAYMTNQATILPIASDSVRKQMEGKLGCPTQIGTISGKIDDPNAIGSFAGTTPNAIVSRQLQAAQPCSRTGVSLQAMGATNPDTNTASWKACMKTQSDWSTATLTSTTSDAAIEECRVQATDNGYPAFGVTLNTDSSYTCSMAPHNYNTNSISTGAYDVKTTSVITKVDGGTSNTVFAILYNGQMATGELAASDNDISKMSSYTAIGLTSPISGCNALTRPAINVTSATYGGNCSGKSVPGYAKLVQGSSTYNIQSGNWTAATNKAVQGQTTAGYTIGGGDPAFGCGKGYSASYTCTGSDTKSISIDPVASYQTAMFDCQAEANQCGLSRLTIGDDGNVVLTNGDGSIIWQSGATGARLAYPSRVASKGKYGRNYLQAGEFLRQGEFVGSPSGTYWITAYLNTNNQLGVGIRYAVISCSGVTNVTQNPTSQGAFGDVGPGSKPAMGVYTMSEGSVTPAPRAFAYVDDEMKARPSTGQHTLGTKYTKLSGYNSPGNDLASPIPNSTPDNCTSECSARDDCYGIVFDKSNNNCWLKGASMFPVGHRNLDSTTDTYVRMIQPTYNKSCSTDVIPSYANVITGLPLGDPMTMSSQCGLAKAISAQQAVVKAKFDALEQVAGEVSAALKQLAAEDQSLDNRLLKEMRRLQKDTETYRKVVKQTGGAEETVPTTNAMASSSSTELSSDSVQYMLWAALAGVGVLAALKASR